MKTEHNVSAQRVSWIKSNARNLPEGSIENLFFPEAINEFIDLLNQLRLAGKTFELIGYSSNTLFLPSYKVENLICTKYLKHWEETDTEIICDCGVNVSLLSREMVAKGYVGFEGLTDLPGTIAAGVYGNCGCRGCSVNELVNWFTLMDANGEITKLTTDDLHLSYRSTTLKRGELKGTILQVGLKKILGNAEDLKILAEKNHQIRLKQQPSGANNLGTTFNGDILTSKGKLFYSFQRLLTKITFRRNSRSVLPIMLQLYGMKKFTPYVFLLNRYMFLDETAHTLFPEYIRFMHTIHKDSRLEIEIRS